MLRTLQPGITLPDFSLPSWDKAANGSTSEYAGKKLVLVFFPSLRDQELILQLAQFNSRAADFEALGAVLIGVTSGPLQALPFQPEPPFRITLDDCSSQGPASRFGLLQEDGSLSPGVFVIDEGGVVVRAYPSDQFPHLPNPAAVLRGMKKLPEIPRPPAVAHEDWSRGPLDAPVVLIEYGDYQCGPCREAYRLLRQIVPQFGDRILWIHRHLPLRHSHPLAQGAAEAAEAAGAQGRFWEMHDRLFEAEGRLEREHLLAYAAEIGLDMPRFIQDLDERRYKDAVDEDFKQAVKHKIKLPPALFVNTLPFEGPRNAETLCSRIESLLACYDDCTSIRSD